MVERIEPVDGGRRPGPPPAPPGGGGEFAIRYSPFIILPRSVVARDEGLEAVATLAPVPELEGAERDAEVRALGGFGLGDDLGGTGPP